MRCEKRPRPANGKKRGNRKVDSVVKFFCKRGFYLKGPSSVKCEYKSGQAVWSDDFPTCEPSKSKHHYLLVILDCKICFISHLLVFIKAYE